MHLKFIQATNLLYTLTIATAFVLEVDPDVNRDTVQLITTKGYPAETHYVTTSDGYVLALHRIPRSAKDPSPGVVFLQHGIAASSADWVINQANQSLGFILADAGFDVWMGNVRGNVYSRNHTYLSPSDEDFWDFSFDEHAEYDLPAMIDYVLQFTEEEKLVYIGNSMGTVMGFAGFSTQPKLEAKIKLFIALAPVARVGHIEGALAIMADLIYGTGTVHLFNLAELDGEFIPSSELTNFLVSRLCPQPLLDEVCQNIVFLIAGVDTTHLNTSRLPVYLSHLPAGTSWKNIFHFARQANTKNFHRYDYSAIGNLIRYGTFSPPEYDITAMTVKTATFSGSIDWIANPTDVAWLRSQIRQHVFQRTVTGYDHADFIWSLDAATVLYPDIISVIKNHS